MEKNEIILPKVFEDRNGKYPQHKNKYKISYSQHTSWKSEEYQYDYIVQYFSGAKLPDGIWALYGGEVGTFIEHTGNKEPYPEFSMLSQGDKDFLLTLDYPENCVYEDEICVDFGDFVCEGYTDRTEFLEESKIGIRDYKTGNLEKKKDFYESDEYAQTTLYCFQKKQEGFEVDYSEVVLLGRKGNNMTIKGKHYPIKLSGEKLPIDTPYSEERAQKILSDIRKSAEQISDLYKIFLKFFGKAKIS